MFLPTSVLYCHMPPYICHLHHTGYIQYRTRSFIYRLPPPGPERSDGPDADQRLAGRLAHPAVRLLPARCVSWDVLTRCIYMIHTRCGGVILGSLLQGFLC